MQCVSIAPPLSDLFLPPSLYPFSFQPTLLLLSFLPTFFYLSPSHPVSLPSSFLFPSILLPFSALPNPSSPFYLPFLFLTHQMCWCNNSVLPLYAASTRMETMTFEWTQPWWVGLGSKEYTNREGQDGMGG